MVKKSISDVLINFKGDHKDLDNAIGGSKSSLTQFASSARSATGALIKIGAAGAVAMAGLTFAAWKATTSFSDYGVELDKAMKVTGLGAQTITEMAYAAEQEHASIEDLQKGWGRLSKSMLGANDGLATSKRIFDELGVSILDNHGNLKKVDVMTLEVADAFKGMTDDTKKAALAQELFGKSGINLIPFLEMGSKGIQELGADSKRLGNIWTDDMAASSKKFDDKLTELRYSLRTTKWALGNELMPEFDKIVDWLMENSDWMKTTFTEIFDIEVTEFGDLAVKQLDKIKNWVDENKSSMEWLVDSIKGIFEWRTEAIAVKERERADIESRGYGARRQEFIGDVGRTAFPRGEQSINIVLDHYAVDKFLRGEVVNVTGTNVMAGT